MRAKADDETHESDKTSGEREGRVNERTKGEGGERERERERRGRKTRRPPAEERESSSIFFCSLQVSFVPDRQTLSLLQSKVFTTASILCHHSNSDLVGHCTGDDCLVRSLSGLTSHYDRREDARSSGPDSLVVATAEFNAHLGRPKGQ